MTHQFCISKAQPKVPNPSISHSDLELSIDFTGIVGGKVCNIVDTVVKALGDLLGLEHKVINCFLAASKRGTRCEIKIIIS
jgi:hypothetical protein